MIPQQKEIAILELNTVDLPSTELDIIACRGLHAKHVYGRYKGVQNNAYVVIVNDDDDRVAVESLARQYNQESVLFSRSDRSSYLWFTDDGQTEEIGKLRTVANLQSEPDSYTYDPTTNLYWICE